MNLGTILTKSYQYLNHPASPGSDVVTRLTSFANDAMKEVLADPILASYLRRTIPFATVSGVSACALPQAVDEILRIVDRTNDYPLDPVDLDWIRIQDPGQITQSGTPQVWALKDESSAIARQPADSSQLYVKSSAAGDTTQTAYIELMNSDGYVQTATATLTGTTAVTLGPADGLIVIDFYLSAVPVGEVTLNEDSGAGTELAKIGIGRTRAQYTIIEVFPQPSSAITLYADVKMVISDLVNSTDEPLIPDKFCEIIVCGIRKREWLKRENPKEADRAEGDYNKWKRKMHDRAHQSLGRVAPSRGRFSQLGPYYPPGS